MNYNYLIVFIFLGFLNLKLEIKKLFFLFVVLFYFLYKKKLEYDEKNYKTTLYPELKILNDDLIKFYFDNIYLMKFDSINFNESLRYTKKFIDLYNNIHDDPIKYYQYDLLNSYKLKSLKSLENIQFSIPSNKNNNNDLIQKIILLNKLLSKYKLKIINYENINIYTKYYDEIKAYNYK